MQHNKSLRQQRLRHNWRMTDLADRLGTTTTTIKRWERGSQQPGMYFRARLCELFGLSAQELGLETEIDLPPQPLEREQDVRPEQERLWTVPYLRNPHFTGRDDVLTLLDQRFMPVNGVQARGQRQFALTHPQALIGLGGIGKTQIAVEYAYRAFTQERYRYTLWITAANEEALLTSFAALAERLPAFRSRGESDQRSLASALVRWLELCEQPWLLIFDNVDDLSFIQPYLPRRGNGNILLTTRVKAVGSFALSLEVETMEVEEGVQLLLRRAQRSEHISARESNEAYQLVLALKQFPLALDQAGAYIDETGCSIADYLQLYQQDHFTFLARRGMQVTGYPDSVVTTWSLSFQRVERLNDAAADLLCLCALLAPDHIPLELLTEGAPYWPPALRDVVVDPVRLNQLLGDLLRFSLIKRLSTDRLISMHRFVQIVQKRRMSALEQGQWSERIVRAVQRLFPHNADDDAAWPLCQRYLEQALACDTQIQEQHLLFPEAADVLEWTGIYLRERASNLLAEPLLLRALSMRELLTGSEHPDTAKNGNSLAALYYEQGSYEQAEPLFLRSLRLGEQAMGAGQPLVGASLNGLANIYRAQGKYEQAERFYQRARSIWEQQEGAERYHVTTSLNGLANIYREQGKYTQAERLFLQMLAICEQQKGLEHSATASALNNLANLYLQQGKYELAGPLYQRALHLLEQHLGYEHPQVAGVLNNLAFLYSEQGKYEQAEPLYQQALHILEQQMGYEHPQVAYMLNNLAFLYAEQGKYAQAEPLCQRALHMWEQQGEQDHPQMAYPLNNLANIFLQQGKYAQAEPLCQQALRIWEQYGEPEHPQLAYTLNNLANIYLRQGKYAQAEPLCQRALSICEQQGGPAHPQMVYTLHRFALLSSFQGKSAEALGFFQRALHLCVQRLGAGHIETATLLFDFASFQHAQGAIRESIDLYQRALPIHERVSGRDHPVSVETRTRLAELSRLLDQREKTAPFERKPG